MVFHSYRKVGMFVSLLFIFFLQIGLSPSEAAVPSPYVYTPIYPSSITLGDYAEIYVRAENYRGTSDDGAIVISFPQMTGPNDESYVYKVDSSLGDAGSNYMEHARGDLIWHRDMGNGAYRVYASYLKVEWCETNWTYREVNFLKVKVKPRTTGNFYFYVRSSMGQGGTYYNYPTSSSYIDQQGWEAKRYRITVLAPGDSYEPDNSSGQAKTISDGVRQTHSIVPANDVDWVKFNLSNTSNITIETAGSSGDTRMWLYNSSISQLVYDDDGGSGYFSKITKDGLPPGTYYAKIDEYGNNNEISTYYLSLNVVSIQPPSPSVSANVTSFTLGVGETRDVKFTLTNSGGISNRSYLDMILSSDAGLEADIVSFTSNWWDTGYPKIQLDGTAIWKRTDTTQGTLTNHPTAIESYRGTDWSSGSSGYITVRIKGKSAGTHYIYYRGAMNPKGVTESNYAPDNFIRDPTSGSVELCTGWYAKKITVTVINPSPSVSANYSSITLGVGETKDITFTLSNEGGISDYSYLDINFSDGASLDGLDVVSTVSKSSIWQTVKRHPDGDPIWRKTDTTKGTLASHSLNYEAYKEASDWSRGASGSVTLRVKALESGTWYIKYRGSMNPKYVTPKNYSPNTYVRTPTSGETDQQGWYAKKVTVLVNTAPNASMSGPTSANISLTVGESQTFTVKGTDSDGNLKGAKWYLDGALQATHLTLSGTSGTDSWNYAFDTAGTYTVEALVFDANNASSNQVRWTVEVPPPPSEAGTPSAPEVGVPNIPDKPAEIDGRTEGVTGKSYTFTTSATDPDGDQVQYGWDWGDGTAIEWSPLGSSGWIDSRSHAYSSPGTYTIKVKAKDKSGKESKDWSDAHAIRLYKIKATKEFVITFLGDKPEENIIQIITRETLKKAISKGITWIAEHTVGIIAGKITGFLSTFISLIPNAGVDSLIDLYLFHGTDVEKTGEVLPGTPVGIFLSLFLGDNANNVEIKVKNINEQIVWSKTIPYELISEGWRQKIEIVVLESLVLRETGEYSVVASIHPKEVERKIRILSPTPLKINESMTYSTEGWEKGTIHDFWFTADACSKMGSVANILFTYKQAYEIIKTINKFQHGGLGIKIGVAIAKVKITWDLMRLSKEAIHEMGEPTEWGYRLKTRDKSWWSHILEPLDQIAEVWREATSTPFARFAGVLSKGLNTWQKVDDIIMENQVKIGDSITLNYAKSNSVSYDDGTNILIAAHTFDRNVNLRITLINPTLPIIKQVKVVADSPEIVRTMGLGGTEPLNEEVTIAIPYSDTNEDGIVDGTQINESDLAMFHLDENKGEWELVENSQVNPEANTVMVETKKLGTMCVARKTSGKPPSPAEIICQYVQSQEKVLLRNKVNGELKEEITGGELKVFSVDKGLIFEKKFGDDEVVSWDVSNIAEGRYKIIFRTISGKKFKPKVIIDRRIR